MIGIYLNPLGLFVNNDGEIKILIPYNFIHSGTTQIQP